jgi:hypothetical protein
LLSTMAQKAVVLGGGAFGSKPSMLRSIKHAATSAIPPSRYNVHNRFQ